MSIKNVVINIKRKTPFYMETLYVEVILHCAKVEVN